MVEGGEVPGFLVVHVLHEGTQVRVGFDDGGGLRGVDQGGGEFAGLVDAELGQQAVLDGGMAWLVGRGVTTYGAVEEFLLRGG